MTDLIERWAVIELLSDRRCNTNCFDESEQKAYEELSKAIEDVKALPSAQPEPLTDKEQRIFFAAMAREEKVCEEVDRNYVREPYEDSLMSVCKAIRRKVKDTLWT